jgi:hypothetical protein
MSQTDARIEALEKRLDRFQGAIMEIVDVVTQNVEIPGGLGRIHDILKNYGIRLDENCPSARPE